LIKLIWKHWRSKKISLRNQSSKNLNSFAGVPALNGKNWITTSPSNQCFALIMSLSKTSLKEHPFAAGGAPMPTGKVTRRQFGKALTASAMGAALNFPAVLLTAKTGSPVVIAVSDSLKRVNHRLIKEQVAPYLNKAVCKLTGCSSSQAAWKSLVAPNEKVGIKLSCLPGLPLSSSYGLVAAVTDNLLAAGVKAENIIVWERSDRELEKAGFHLSRKGICVRGTDSYPGDGYSDTIEFAHSVGTRFSKIMEEVDALINIPVLKDHDLCGVSISMKNFYGAIYNPNKFHRNNCNPFVAELNTHALIKDKLRLIVCDASRIQVNNGPAYVPRFSVDYGGLLVSRDPVALDFQGWQIVEAERKRLGLSTLKVAEREPEYIGSAEKLLLGRMSAAVIQV